MSHTYTITHDQKYENLDGSLEGDYYTKFNKKRDLKLVKYQINSDMVSIESHWHDWIEFTFMESGVQDILVEGKKFSLFSGDFLMIHQGAIHESTLQHGTTKITLQIQESYMKQHFPSFDLTSVDCNTTTISTIEEYYKYKDIINIYKNMTLLFEKDDEESKIGFKGLLYLFIYKLNLNFKVKKAEREEKEPKDNHMVIKIISYINGHYQDAIKLEDLSHTFHISKQYIARIFKSEMKCTFKEFLSDVRLKHAEYDIVHSDKAMIDICMESGFPNYQSFVKAIKDKKNLQPSDFRKEKK